jgi:predicted PurR-regulated permease PerM
MVGAYIVTRMVVTIREHLDSRWTVMLSVLTIITAVVCLGVIVYQDVTATSQMQEAVELPSSVDVPES